jgi:predicted nucleic acid-binding protein
MIAAQALAAQAILVTRDQAFRHLQQDLQLQDWTKG